MQEIVKRLQEQRVLNALLESEDERAQRKAVKSIVDDVLRSRGENNSTGKYDAFTRKMINNWAGSGQDREFIQAAIEKSFDKEMSIKSCDESLRYFVVGTEEYDNESLYDEIEKTGEIIKQDKRSGDWYLGDRRISNRGVELLKADTRFNKFFDDDDSDIVTESSEESPHTYNYKGYTIQVYGGDGYGIYKDGKKIISGMSTEGDVEEFIDAMKESVQHSKLRDSIKSRMTKSTISEAEKLGRGRWCIMHGDECIDSYTDKKDAEDWVEELYRDGDFKRGELTVVDSSTTDIKDDISESHTVELYKTHTSDPERKRFTDYKSAKEFADSQTTGDYEEIFINIPAAGGPSTVNSWSKSDGWFREDLTESQESDQKYLIKYVDKSDNSAEDEVIAPDEKSAIKIVKPRAYRILSVERIS